MGKRFPNYTRLVREMAEREAVKKAAEAEGIEVKVE
jgi:hypothetical protein